MLVSTGTPLPTNSTSPWPGMPQDLQTRLANMGAAVLKAQQANRCPAPPASFLNLGANVVTDVALTQGQAQASATSGAAGSPSSLSASSTPGTPDYFNGPDYGYYRPGVSTSPTTNPNNPAIANAPVITGFPGSYGPGSGGRNANANGCASVPAPTAQPAPQKPQMPVMLPAVSSPPPPPIAQPLPSGPPAWNNLCWALRNAWVDSSQFTPSEFNEANYACSQLGYAGGCPPNADVLAFFSAGRAAGTLPHISVTPAMLASIPQAPNLTGVSCPQSQQMGMAGVAPSWASAFGGSCLQSMRAQGGAPGGSSLLFWAGVAAAAFGIYELFKEGK